MPACTDAGGISELVKDDLNGVLVPVEDPMMLVRKLEKFIADPLLILEMGRKAREMVISNFSMEKMVGELETIYSETLK